MNEFIKIKKCLIIGLVGAFVTIIGEMLQGAVPSVDTADKMSKLFSSFENLAVWRIGLGSTVGALGILLQFFGVYGIYLSFKNKETKTAKIYYIGMYIFSILGSIVHILMSMMVYAFKISMDHMIEVTIWFVMPILVIFFVGYIPFAIAMMLQFLKRESVFPQWMFILNPLFGKIFFGAVTAVLPSCALVNGISYSNMGLSSVILFAVAVFVICQKKEKYGHQ